MVPDIIYKSAGAAAAMLLKMNGKICAPSCEYCGEAMTFDHMTPRSRLIPELRTFVCSDCGDVETIEMLQIEEAA